MKICMYMKHWHEIVKPFMKYSGNNLHYNPTQDPTSCMTGNKVVYFCLFIYCQMALSPFVQGVFGTSL